ncbi:MAG: aminoacetone oxidase family FAD-binding enzyme [Dehalococcoidales bacterium]|nr:aminoacetone oxidase family FAD-binding enzyme [Dehalococcoidales bacterium]
MQENLTVVIGGGAAGICAAINKGRRGEPVIICEKAGQLGRKILASGNGRCNLLNDNLSEKYYNRAARELVKSIFARYGKSEILDFFKGLGLNVYSQDGRIFPVTNQAASVLKVLELELKRLAIPVEYNFNCSAISIQKGRIVVSGGAGKQIECRKVILTGGGKSYPVLGSDGSTYEIAKHLGHTIVEPVPSAVPLIVKDSLCRYLQGQRISSGVKSIIDGKEGRTFKGELLFTKYGLSGTCILDVSNSISVALNRQKKANVFLSVDLVPFMDKPQLRDELARRKKSGYAPEDMLTGILPNKLTFAVKDIFEQNDIETAVDSLKARRFPVVATKGWNEAEFTSGGISVNEVNSETLESKLHKGVYFAGEVLDADGERGGYNLAWAWASGFVAGMTG